MKILREPTAVIIEPAVTLNHLTMNCEIGEYVYDQFTTEKRVGKDDPFIKDRMNAIRRMRLSIKDIEEDIHVIQKTEPGRYDGFQIT